MKILVGFTFALAFILSSPAQAFSEDIAKSPEPATVEEMDVEHLRSMGSKPRSGLKVDLYLRNFTDWDRAKIERAKVILEAVINSEEFKEEVLNYTYQGEKRFHRNEGMSNHEIYDHFMAGAEDLMPEADGIMNFDLTLYWSWNPWSSVKGYTKPDTMRIWLHKKFYRRDSWNEVDVAANLAHEWVHKMGFGHAYNRNPERPFTVPYAVGNIVAAVAQRMGY